MRLLRNVRERARARPWAAVSAASFITIGLVQLVSIVSGTLDYQHLLWNLFLAWIPLPLAAAAYVAWRRDLGLPLIVSLLGAWLLFFPNAPYLVTELNHFGELGSSVPAELDLATLVMTATAGLAVGFASLYIVQRVVGHLYGLHASRATVVVALVLASVGVYMGRVLRWSSWDALTSPEGVIADLSVRIANPLVFYEAWFGIAAFALFLFVSYRSLLRLAGRDRPTPVE